MNAKEVTRIMDLIKEAEKQSAMARGAMSSIEEKWLKDYGTKDYSEVVKLRDSKKEELDGINRRMEAVYDRLVNCHDWDALAQKLEDVR